MADDFNGTFLPLEVAVISFLMTDFLDAIFAFSILELNENK